MTKRRQLSEYQSFIVINMKGQSRIVAKIASLEAHPERVNGDLAAAGQLNNLRAELLILQLAMNAHLEMNAKDQLKDLEIAVPARRRKGSETPKPNSTRKHSAARKLPVAPERPQLG